MKSKTKISKQTERKGNSVLVETIIAAKKSPGWIHVAALLSGPRRKQIALNLTDINELTKDVKDGETMVVPGKVLSQGELNKKIKIVALSFSEKAKEKLDKARTQTSSILDEIKKNPEARDIKILVK